MLSVTYKLIVLNVIMLSVTYDECHIQAHCAECHNAECHMLNVIMLSFFILGVVALFMLSVM